MASVDFQSVDILADLRSLPLSGGVPAVPLIEVIRATTGTTAGGGAFRFDTASLATDDGATVLRPSALTTGQPGRWLRRDTTRPVAGWWGAAGDGITDDGPALAAADAYAATTGGSLFIDRPHKVDQDLAFTAPVAFEGAGRLVVGHEVLSFTGTAIGPQTPGPVMAVADVPPYLLFTSGTGTIRRGRRYVAFGEELLPRLAASWTASTSVAASWYFVNGSKPGRGQLPLPSRVEIGTTMLTRAAKFSEMAPDHWAYGVQDGLEEGTLYLRLASGSPVSAPDVIRAMYFLPAPQLNAVDVDIATMPDVRSGYTVSDVAGTVSFTVGSISGKRLYSTTGAPGLAVGTPLQYRVDGDAPWQPLGTVAATVREPFDPHRLWGMGAFEGGANRLWVRNEVKSYGWTVARPHRISFGGPVIAPEAADLFVDGDIRFAAGQVASIAWFGASTAAVDNQGAIQAALDGMPVAGGTVLVPSTSGRYMCGDPTVLGQFQIEVGSNTTLRWLGRAAIACDETWRALRGGLISLRRSGESAVNITLVDAEVDAGHAPSNNGIGVGTNTWERWLLTTVRGLRLERPHVYNVTGDNMTGQGGKALTFQFGVEDVIVSDARVEDAFIAISCESSGRRDIDQAAIRNVLVNGMVARRVSRLVRVLQSIDPAVADGMRGVRMTGLVAYDAGLTTREYVYHGTPPVPLTGTMSGAIELLGGSADIDAVIVNPDNRIIGSVVSCMASDSTVRVSFTGTAVRLIDMGPATGGALGALALGATGRDLATIPRQNNRILVETTRASSVNDVMEAAVPLLIDRAPGAGWPIEGDTVASASGGTGTVLWSTVDSSSGLLMLRPSANGFTVSDTVTLDGVPVGTVSAVHSPVERNHLAAGTFGLPVNRLLAPAMRAATLNQISMTRVGDQRGIVARAPDAILAAGTASGWLPARRSVILTAGTSTTLWTAEQIPAGWTGTIAARSAGGTRSHVVRAMKAQAAATVTLHDLAPATTLALYVTAGGDIALRNDGAGSVSGLVTYDDMAVYR
ncbi:hypothetical protein WG926_05155 [Tistrella sp. BH-R2-4]|uniref:Tip attachment protein J domain-containing protein n=1 Tax=Tistrella arctica TaxID=3133430 RepID=A0ABU9YG24_9PROT